MKDCEEIREWYEEHRAKKETHRMQNAKLQLEAKGLAVSINMSQKRCEIQHKGNTIFFYPYTGWFTGKGVKDGRGLSNLLKQLK